MLVRPVLKAAQMRAAVVVVDVVGEGEDGLVVAVVVLHRDFDDELLLRIFLGKADDRVTRGLAFVEKLDVLDQALVVFELLRALDALILEDDLDAGVQKRQFAKAIGERFVDEIRCRERAWDRA